MVSLGIREELEDEPPSATGQAAGICCRVWLRSKAPYRICTQNLVSASSTKNAFVSSRNHPTVLG